MYSTPSIPMYTVLVRGWSVPHVPGFHLGPRIKFVIRFLQTKGDNYEA